MKIGIDIRTLMETSHSGVPEYTKGVIDAILKQEKESEKNQYKLFYNSASDVRQNISEFNYDNVEIVNNGYPNKIFNNLMQGIIGTPKIDRLLGVDLFFMPNIGFISLSSKCKKIITIHDLSFLRYPQFFSLKRRLWHYFINVKRLINKFDQIIAVSENTKRDIVEICNISEEKIKVIYSGINPVFCQIDKDNDKLKRVRKKYNLPENFILFLGTLEPRKNVEGIIRAFDILKRSGDFANFKLIIAGKQGWKTRDIYSEWENSEYKSDIRFLGYVENDDKVYLYNLASVFVYPSFYEGFGFPPLEAMASGAPVVTSKTSSLPEVVKDGVILVDPFNDNDISSAISIILRDNQVKENLVNTSREIVKDYTWERAGRDYLSLWQRQ